VTGPALTFADVERLSRTTSAPVRAETAARIAQQTAGVDLSTSEKIIAQDIFRLLARDAEVQVRHALAENLRSSPLLPRDVAVQLANDVETVALPILEFSEVLTSEDLIEIVKSDNAAKQQAIAGRKTVCAEVASALIERGEQSVVKAVVDNPGAHITDPSMETVIDRFGTVEAIQESMIKRSALPITAAERLVALVADHLRGTLLARHKVSPDLLSDIVLQSSERVTAGLAMAASDEEIEALVTQLHDNGRLTPSLVLRAICLGNLKFFEHAMATLAGAPLQNARLLAHDPGGTGLETLCEKAKVPAGYRPAVKVAVSVVDETPLDAGPSGTERYSRRVIERVLTQYESADAEFEGEDLDYLLAKLSQLKPITYNLH